MLNWKYFAAVDRTAIWYLLVIKTIVGFKIAEMTILTTMAIIHLLFKIVNLKILENSQEYVYNEVIFL